MATPDLEVEGVSKSYGGVVALDNAHFRANRGEVHAVVGENGAGKSTLIKALTGAVRPDAGTIHLFGDQIEVSSPHEAYRLGIAAIFQELALIPDFSVAQNVWFRREPLTRARTVSGRRLRQATNALFDSLGLTGIDPSIEVRRLPLAQRQLVEVARNISMNPKLLILDEATSALSPHEVEWLLELSRRQARQGAIVIFVSHRLGEVRQVADRVTILRNGRHIDTHVMNEIDDDLIVNQMLGRKPARLYPAKDSAPGERVALRVEDLRSGYGLRGVTFELHEGEILGLGGLQGQGQAELLLSLYGVLKSRGRILVYGIPQRIRSPRDALGAGVGLTFVPEDRQNQGLLLPKTIRENVSLPVLAQISRWGFVRRRDERRVVLHATRRLNLVARDLEASAQSLSGGNQQKIVIAKLLLTRARILLLFDLARGVDVGTKAEIFELLRELATDGYSILFYSTDLQEIINVSDRVVVLAGGRMTAQLQGAAMTEENVLRASIGDTRYQV